MKKLLAFSLLSSSIFLSANSVKADWDYWGYKDVTETINGHTDTFRNLYTINSSTGEGTLRQRFCYGSNTSTMNTCNSTTGLPILRDPIDIAYPDRGTGALARNFVSPPAPFSPSSVVQVSDFQTFWCLTSGSVSQTVIQNHAYLIRRNGIFYFSRRVPADALSI